MHVHVRRTLVHSEGYRAVDCATLMPPSAGRTAQTLLPALEVFAAHSTAIPKYRLLCWIGSPAITLGGDKAIRAGGSQGSELVDIGIVKS